MAFWNRKTDSRRSPASIGRHPKTEGITAAAQRYDLTSEADVKRLAKSQEQWQADAWFYVDAVGEAKYAERFIANAFRQIRLFAAWQRDGESEPVNVRAAVMPTDSAADLPSGEEASTIDPADFLDEKWAAIAERIVAEFAARDGGQAVLMERMGVNLFVPGECYLVNRKVPERRPAMIADPAASGGERLERPDEIPKVDDWEVRAADEIRKSTRDDKRVMLVDSPDQRDGVELDADAYVERVWRKHGRWSAWADSNFRAAVGTLEELDLLNRLARASIRSALVAGFVTFPDELDFGAADQPAGEGSGAPGKKVSLDREIVELFTTVVGDEADPNSIAPAPIRGPKEFLDGIRHIAIPSRYGAGERAQYEDAVKKLARTLDLPVEVLLGMMQTTFANAAQIDQDTYDDHLAPLVSVAVEAVTFGLLRPMMLEEGCPPDVVARLVAAADPSQLVRRPDRGKVAAEGHAMFALSDKAWRQANSFGDDDAPSDDELRRRLGVTRSILTSDLSVLLLEESGLLPEGTADRLAAQKQAGNDETIDVVDEPADEEAAAAVTAAASRVGAAHSLALADRVLRERLLATFDASLTRAVEKAGARLRTKASRVGDARAALNAAGTVPNTDVGRVLGPALVAALATDDDLLAGAFEDLHDRFDQWVGDTQAAALDTLEAVAEVPPSRRAELEAEQEEDRDDAWAWLLGALLALASARIRGGDLEPGGDEGEFDPTIAVPPGIVREALGIAGGEVVERSAGGGLMSITGQPVGGPSTGSVIRRAFAQAGFPWTGYVWNYGMAPRQRPFEPHRALAGQNFATWTDPVLANEAGQWPGVAFWHPGDHRYCRCDFAPVIAEAAAAAAYPDGTTS